MAGVTRLKSVGERRLGLALRVVAAHENHARSTTQREDAAAELGMSLADYRVALDMARRLGFDVDHLPPLERENGRHDTS